MDSRSGSGDISDDCGELSRLRRERHRLLLRVSEGRISVAAWGGNKNKRKLYDIYLLIMSHLSTEIHHCLT